MELKKKEIMSFRFPDHRSRSRKGSLNKTPSFHSLTISFRKRFQSQTSLQDLFADPTNLGERVTKEKKEKTISSSRKKRTRKESNIEQQSKKPYNVIHSGQPKSSEIISLILPFLLALILLPLLLSILERSQSSTNGITLYPTTNDGDGNKTAATDSFEKLIGFFFYYSKLRSLSFYQHFDLSINLFSIGAIFGLTVFVSTLICHLFQSYFKITRPRALAFLHSDKLHFTLTILFLSGLGYCLNNYIPSGLPSISYHSLFGYQFDYRIMLLILMIVSS